MRRGKTFGTIALAVVVILMAALMNGMVKQQRRASRAAEQPVAARPSDASETHFTVAMYECWLKELPDVMNDLAANAAISECKRLHPEEPGPTPAKESRWFGYASAAECTADKARRTPSTQAARGVAAACNAIY